MLIGGNCERGWDGGSRFSPLTDAWNPRMQPDAGLKPAVQAMAQKTEKSGKEQEVFLGVKGNAQASSSSNIGRADIRPCSWLP